MSPSTPRVLLRATAGDDVVVDVPLGHGQDPVELLARGGWRLERPLSAHREGPDLRLAFAVRAASPCSPPQRMIDDRPVAMPLRPERDAGLVLEPGEQPIRRQRVSGAVLVTAQVPPGLRDSAGAPGPGGECVLATSYSGLASRWSGRWGLPGGGIDPGEEPEAAAHREACEETGQDVVVGEWVFVQSAHWVGRAPSGVAEDFHALRLVFRGTCPTPGDVVIHDVGGTTDRAAWVSVDMASGLDWAPGPRAQLAALGVLSRS